MINFQAFVDELNKIAAVKSRKGTPPIRVHNLATKTSYEGGTGKVTKLAALPEAASGALDTAKTVGGAAANWGKKNWLFPAGIAAGLVGRQALHDYRFGRQVRKQQQRR